MDYKKLDKWIRDLLQEEGVHKVTDIYILAEDIVNMVKDLQLEDLEEQDRLIEQITALTAEQRWTRWKMNEEAEAKLEEMKGEDND